MSTERDIEAVSDIIGPRAGFQPTTMVAERILASPWLAAYIAAARAEEREALADEVRYVHEHGLPDDIDSAPESPYFEAWLRRGGNPEIRALLPAAESREGDGR